MVKKDNRGVTLLELLVSLAIIGFLVFAFFRVINSTKRIDIKNDRDIKALNIAQSQIEDLRSQIKSLGDKEKLILHDKDIYIKDIGKIDFKIVNYEKNIEDQVYKVEVKLKKTDVDKELYLFEIEVGVRLKDNYFSKRNTFIKTKILSNKGSISEEEGSNNLQGENYLNYCLSKALNTFSKLPDKTLANLISMDKIIGNKTLIDMSKQDKIDIFNMMPQVEKIIKETEKNIAQTNVNRELDLLYKGKFYIKASKYTLETLNKKMDEDLNESHRLNWLNTHNMFIQSYTLNMQKLYNDLWIYGLANEYNYYIKLFDANKALFNKISSEINGEILILQGQHDSIEKRKYINNIINAYIDKIISHQVYDIEKHIREEVNPKILNTDYKKNISEDKKHILDDLEELTLDLLELKASIYNSNYYDKNSNLNFVK